MYYRILIKITYIVVLIMYTKLWIITRDNTITYVLKKMKFVLTHPNVLCDRLVKLLNDYQHINRRQNII